MFFRAQKQPQRFLGFFKARYPEGTGIECDTPSLAELLGCDRALRHLNGPLKRGLFSPCWGVGKLPIGVNGAFPLLNVPFSLPKMPQWAIFPLGNRLENSPLRKGALRGSWPKGGIAAVVLTMQ